jgi:hypothetical protein
VEMGLSEAAAPRRLTDVIERDDNFVAGGNPLVLRSFGTLLMNVVND